MGSNRRKHKFQHRAKRESTTQRAAARSRWLLLLLAMAAAVTAVLVMVKSPEDTPPSQATPQGAAQTTQARAAPATADAAAPTPEVLVGHWQRTDGDYALEVRRVGPHGQAEVAYTNPGPINVSRAEVKHDGNRLFLFVELRDVNYPGSTYTLAYEPGQEALIGSYFQPARGQTYEVAFMRAK
jgi:uncharacterized protein (DUF2147 family)